jgi:hypothetical protein
MYPNFKLIGCFEKGIFRDLNCEALKDLPSCTQKLCFLVLALLTSNLNKNKPRRMRRSKSYPAA